MSPALLAAWAQLLPVAAVMLAVVYLPGTLTLTLLGSRPMAALAGGPLITAAMIGVGGFVLGSCSLPYGWGSFAALTGTLWATGALTRLVLARGGGAGGGSQREAWMRGLRRRETLVVLGAALVALAALWLPICLVVDPALPNPKVDPMYHYNVLNAVLETGNISMNSAVDYNYGLRVGHVMYPTVWHAVAVLGAPLTGIVPAANTLAYLVTPVVFVVNTAVLSRLVLHHSERATVAAVLAAGALPAFGAGMLLVRSFWPNGLAIAMLPGLLMMLVLFVRRIRWSRLRRHPLRQLLDLGVVLTAGLGLGFTHPSVLFSFVLIAAAPIISVLPRAHGIVRRSGSRQMHRVFVALLVVLPLLTLAVVLFPQRVRSYLLRSADQSWDGLLLKGTSLLMNWPTDITNPAGVAMALVFGPLLLGGLVLLLRQHGRRWIPVAWGVGAALVAGSYLPLPVLSGLSGLWYADTYRLFGAQTAILPLAVGALVQWAGTLGPSGDGSRRWCARLVRPRSLVVRTLLVGALIGGSYITAEDARLVGAEALEERPVTDAAVFALLDRIGEELPDGAVVIGDPAAGVAYLPLSSDVESVFTQVNLRDVDQDGIFLARHLDRIGEDPRVCQLLVYYGIGYFYQDAPMHYNYGDRSEAMPGFYQVDTSQGFTLVDEAGSAKLWRIDACGPISPPEDWWQRSWRREGFVQHLDPDARSGNPSQPE